MYNDSESSLNPRWQLDEVMRLYPDNPEYVELKQSWNDEYGQDGWYSWSIANWGTKWRASNVAIDRDAEDILRARFDTAWSPPEAVLKKLSEQFPEIELEYSYNMEGDDPCVNGEILV